MACFPLQSAFWVQLPLICFFLSCMSIPFWTAPPVLRLGRTGEAGLDRELGDPASDGSCVAVVSGLKDSPKRQERPPVKATPFPSVAHFCSLTHKGVLSFSPLVPTPSGSKGHSIFHIPHRVSEACPEDSSSTCSSIHSCFSPSGP